ncbi:hypothetical protein AB3662_21060 [Sorangium cellulosum]|uniref:hypothetical protein n=1 Tax=Sorangium cellulosum TaxID=56 RepID=UPI003D9A0C26
MIFVSASGGVRRHVRAMRIACMRAHLERPTRPTPETLARIDVARGDELDQHLLDAAIARATVAAIGNAPRAVADERWTRHPSELNAGHPSRWPARARRLGGRIAVHLRRDRAGRRRDAAPSLAAVSALAAASSCPLRAAPPAARRGQRRRRRVADMRASAFIYATQAGKSRCLSPCKCALLELKRCDFPVYLFEAIYVFRVEREFSFEGRILYTPFEIFYNSEPFL